MSNQSQDGDMEYTVMMLGVSGAGKSALCNFFFQEDLFKSDDGQISITEKAISHSHTMHQWNSH